ncbi:MAG TPA: acetate/propionate family kinase [Candidatus Limnocylindrales bacterium]
MRVLVLNPGSSSLKSSVIDTATIPAVGPDGRVPATPSTAMAPLAQLDVDWGSDATAGHDPADDIRALVAKYETSGISAESLGAVGYRVVHGGAIFRRPVRVTPDVIAQVTALRDLAPLHNGVAAATMTAGLAALPNLPHVAVFDTAFHATLPEDAYRYPVPDRWFSEWGVRRYGFHGMSVAWSAERAAALVARPVVDTHTIVAHLGSGCSVTAVEAGRSVATSMGMTPLEGLMMGTRAGSIDPGAMLYLLRAGRLDPAELAEDLDHQSGLLGVSGQTSDVRELLRLESGGNAAATLALRLFVRRAAECIAAAATALPRLDAIVFTGGIGENAGSVRARIVARLGSIGVAAIGESGVSEDAVLPAIAPATGRHTAGPSVLRIVAREDLVVAREAARLVEIGARPD